MSTANDLRPESPRTSSRRAHDGASRRTRWGATLLALCLMAGCGSPSAVEPAAVAAQTAADAGSEREADGGASPRVLELAETTITISLADLTPNAATPAATTGPSDREAAAPTRALPLPAARPTLVPTRRFEPVDPALAIADEPSWTFFDHVDAPIRAQLSTAALASAERGHGGRSLGFKVTLEDGTRGYFKPDQAFNGMSWNAEIAAYYLDRELGLGRVAPVVSRSFDYADLEAAAGRDRRVEELHVDEDGRLHGAVIWWVPERLTPVDLPAGWQRWLRVEGSPAAITPFQRPGAYRRAQVARERTPMPAEAPTPDTAERPAELSDLLVFDYLTNNLDRWGGNNTNIRTVGAGGPIMFLDNAAGFTLRRARNSTMDRRLAEVQRFRRSTIDAIRALDVDHYAARLASDAGGPILDAHHLTNLGVRREHLLSHVDQLVAAHGEDAVYAW